MILTAHKRLKKVRIWKSIFKSVLQTMILLKLRKEFVLVVTVVKIATTNRKRKKSSNHEAEA